MTRFVPDTLVMAERNLVRLPRSPDLLIGFTIRARSVTHPHGVLGNAHTKRQVETPAAQHEFIAKVDPDVMRARNEVDVPVRGVGHLCGPSVQRARRRLGHAQTAAHRDRAKTQLTVEVRLHHGHKHEDFFFLWPKDVEVAVRPTEQQRVRQIQRPPKQTWLGPLKLRGPITAFLGFTRLFRMTIL